MSRAGTVVLALLLPACALPVASPPPAAATPAAAAASAPEPGEWDRELPAEVRLLDAPGLPATAYLARVLDEATGLPVEGARVTGYAESDTPMPGIGKPLEVEIADRDGWVLLRDSTKEHWHYGEAQGYGPVGEMGPAEEFSLRRGEDFPLEVRDFLDRPIPGAVVEYFLGCGHTPTVQSVTTDAAGRAVLRCIDPGKGSLWVRAPGATGRNEAYDGTPTDLEPGAGGWVLRCDPSPGIEGVVLDAAGKPVAGAAVGTPEAHRGPWTRTDAEGRFRLLGAAPFEELSVVIDPRTVGPVTAAPAASFPTAPGVVTTVRLGAPGGEAGAAEPVATLHVGLTLEGGVRPSLGWERVVLVREGDGRVARIDLEWKDGAAGEDAEVPYGRWIVKAGRRGGQFLPASTTVEVGPDGAAATLRLREAPRRRPRLLRRTYMGPETSLIPIPFPWPGKLRIAVEDGVADAVPVPGEDGAVFVPAEGPYAAIFEAEDGAVGRVRCDSTRTGEGPELWVPPSPSGFPEPEPRRGDFPEEDFRVLLPDGSPATSYDFLVEAADHPEYEGGRLGEDGTVRRTFRRGDHILVRGDEGMASLRAVIDGPGPWTLRWPATTLAIRALDGAGAPIPGFTVLFEGRRLVAEGGVATLRGMDAGPVRFWVAAPGRRAHDGRLPVRAGEQRTLEVRLRP